jgi:hypothetical protein
VADLAGLTAEDFVPLVGARFDVSGSVPPLVLELTSVDVGKRAFAERPAFSLLFAGPAEPGLEQGLRHLSHAAFEGGLELFLVPVWEPGAGRAYEAVFT